jgi:hypothetical protein
MQKRTGNKTMYLSAMGSKSMAYPPSFDDLIGGSEAKERKRQVRSGRMAQKLDNPYIFDRL